VIFDVVLQQLAKNKVPTSTAVRSLLLTSGSLSSGGSGGAANRISPREKLIRLTSFSTNRTTPGNNGATTFLPTRSVSSRTP
jgi:hypothetical protein